MIHAADCAMAVSGSVSLELLYHTTPTVILYYISPLAFFVQRFFRKVRYITLVNLLTTDDLFPKRVATYDPDDPVDAGVLMPEYLTCEDKSQQVAGHVDRMADRPGEAGRPGGPIGRAEGARRPRRRIAAGGRLLCSKSWTPASGRRCGRIIRSPTQLEEAVRGAA